MFCKKLVYLSENQKQALDDIQKQVRQNGGYVSCMRLMQDSITVFIDNYKEKAVKKYSPIY